MEENQQDRPIIPREAEQYGHYAQQMGEISLDENFNAFKVRMSKPKEESTMKQINVNEVK